MTEIATPKGRTGLTKAALFGLCPKCNAPGLYADNPMRIRFVDRCKGCGLDYTGFNVGDGPAALLIIPVATLIIVLALWLDTAVRPPFWVHMVIWVPFTTIVTFFGIRFAKAALLILEYRRSAKEAQRVINSSDHNEPQS
jgi:uncharacterized protein (DUF983 family)